MTTRAHKHRTPRRPSDPVGVKSAALRSAGKNRKGVTASLEGMPAARTTPASDVPVVRSISTRELPNVPVIRAEPSALRELKKRGYTAEEVFDLVVPKRTLARRQAQKEPLTVEETDKALRLERIASLAEAVFGEKEKAYRWLRRPKSSLEGATPLAFLASEAGSRIVEEMLLRIEHGIFA